MKRKLLISLLAMICSIVSADNWEVLGIYEKTEVPKGTKVLDKYYKTTDIQYLLVPAQIDRGKYKIIVTEESSTLLKIEGTELYLEMKDNKIFKPFSIMNPKVEVVLIVDWTTSKIVYKGLLGDN